jgi:two-component system, LuxR family, sensor histidine kinase TtrS
MPFASFLRRSLLAAGLFGLLAGSCAASVEAADARQEVTIGLVDTFSPDFYIHTYAPTLDNLIEALPQYAFRIVEIDFRHLNDDIARTRPAFLVTSASTFVSLIEKTGAHQVATKKPDMSNDVAHTVASAFIVPMDSPVRTLADARGLRAAIQSRKSFDGWLIAKGEIELVWKS